MEKQEKFIKHYEEGFMPWAHEKPDFNIIDTVESWPIEPCKVLDVGCGTGVESIWLASQGFDVTGVDVSSIAIDMCKENALVYNSKANFRVFDFMTESLQKLKYDFTFDRGFFHGFHTHNERVKIAERFYQVLNNNGLWLSLLGNADGEKRDPGPPLRTANEIISSTEGLFELLMLKTSYFGNEQPNPSKNWVCLMKKRNK